MQLRDYQQQAVDGVFDCLKSHNSTLVVLPTGTGKTVVFSHIIDQWKSGRVMVLAHREELIRQAADKIERVTGERPEIEMASERADMHIFRRGKVVVSSIQTQMAGRNAKRMEKFDPASFGLVVVDEAHHATAPSYQAVIDHYRSGGAKILGVTATPDRSDEAALGRVFESVAHVYEINDAINDGYLVPVHQQFVQVDSLDYSGIRTTAGDLNGGDLAELMEQERNLQAVAAPVIALAKWKRTIVFAASVAHAERLAEIINRKRPNSARWVCGETPRDERAQTLRDFASGQIQFVVNVGVLTEGFDDPGIEVVAIARPTKSRSLYAQMVGRGFRPLPGTIDGLPDADSRRLAIARSRKPKVEVLDFVGNSGKHKLITTADVLGGNYDDQTIDRARKSVQDGGTAADMNEALEEAKRAIAEEKRRKKEEEEEERRRLELAARRKIVAKANMRVQTVDPFDVFDIEPERERGWDTANPLSDKQKEMLERNGIATEGMSKRRAGQLISEIIGRRARGQCSFKQARILQKHGYATDVSFERASAIIDGLAKNGWRRPTEATA
jgi:superfamily II DNA or RNA helicase